MLVNHPLFIEPKSTVEFPLECTLHRQASLSKPSGVMSLFPPTVSFVSEVFLIVLPSILQVCPFQFFHILSLLSSGHHMGC